MNENRISLSFSDEEKTKINNAVQVLNDVFTSKLIALSNEDKKRLFKISDDAIPFIEKVSQYAASNPEFVPVFLNAGEFTKDFTAFNELRGFGRLLSPISRNMEDTAMLAGSEADDFARMYYASVSQAAKMNVPGAQAIYEDLRQRFDAQRGKRPKTPTT
ncbi:MAG TPA: hypothetical protein VGC76_03040 [Pyrinomonadaceae bacterium]|jgi:hypothetical protein